jgi:hypothetical protein
VKRSDVLSTANKYVSHDRQAKYGAPEDTFTKVADLWNAYLGEWADIKPHDAAVMLALLKVARISQNPQHEDNWIDIAGYAACGAELVQELVQESSTIANDDPITKAYMEKQQGHRGKPYERA